MKKYKCLRCKKILLTEELVKIHLQWMHNIPPRKLIEGLEQLKKEFSC